MTWSRETMRGRQEGPARCERRGHGTEGIASMQHERTAEIAWAAGLFEGEGCFAYQGPSATRRSGANVRTEVAMTDFEPVERFHRIVGVGRLLPKPKREAHHNDQLLWRVTDRAGVEAVLELLRPWLSERRMARGEEILSLQAEAMQTTPQPRDASGRRFVSRKATHA